MKIYSIHSAEFKLFGKVLSFPFINAFEKVAEGIDFPETGASYMASVKEFETDENLAYYSELFGHLDIQIGYCWGRNDRLNALEWHKSSEINCALEDMILLLGNMQDIDGDGMFNSKNIKAFLLKKGESIEIYQTTLHFCPCMSNDKPFKNVVVLPQNTNTPLSVKTNDKRLIAKNKWLICHPECKKQVDLGRVVGIKGENIVIK